MKIIKNIDYKKKKMLKDINNFMKNNKKMN